MGRTPEKNWTVIDLLKETQAYFARCGIGSPRLDAELLLAHCLGRDRLGLLLDFDCVLTPAELDRFRELVRRRAGREPVAYITGVKEFWSLPLAVSPDVLIPRPDTEVLVEEALAMARHAGTGSAPRILDIGTGSGAIAIALAHELPEAAIVASDASGPALEAARRNARACGADNITFVKGDGLSEPMTFDGIVSNPPYIPTAHIDALAPEIKNFEPRLALDGGPDGLAFYRAVIPQLPSHLNPRGFVAFEIGDTQAEAVAGMLQAAGAFCDVRLRRDYANSPRVMTAQVR